METDFVDNQPECDPTSPPGTPEEPEEGEVIDDSSESGDISNDSFVKDDVKPATDTVNETEKSSETHSNLDNSGTGMSAGKEEICDANNESENVKDNIEKAGKGADNVGSRPLNVGVEINEGSNIEDTNNKVENTDTEKGDEETSIDSDVRIVKAEITKTDINDGSAKSDNIVTIEEDIDEDDTTSTCIKAAESDEDSSDNVTEAEAEKESAKAEISTSAVIVSDVKKGKPARRVVKPPKQDIAPALTKNQMELLELEMRARAIKAMLKTAK